MCCSGGNACPVVNGTTRLTTPCVNYNPCPVNCTANWQSNGNCTGQCSGGAGFIPEVCFISASASAAAPATAAAAAFKLRSACVPELGAAVLPILQKTQAVVQHSMPCCRTSPIDTSPHMLVYAACARIRFNWLFHCTCNAAAIHRCSMFQALPCMVAAARTQTAPPGSRCHAPTAYPAHPETVWGPGWRAAALGIVEEARGCS